MKVLLHPVQAAPALRRLPPETKKALRAALRSLAKDPSGLSNGLDVKRLDADAMQPIYRLRIGDWRIAFTLDSALIVFRIFHRAEGYGWLQDME